MALQEPYLYWLSSRTSIFRDVRGLFCVVSSSVSLSSHKPYLERYRVSFVVASLLVFFFSPKFTDTYYISFFFLFFRMRQEH